MAAFRFTLVLALHLAVPPDAQSDATLQGLVFDSSGAVLPGATITVRNPTIGFNRSVTTDDGGRYHVDGIPASVCEITATAAGFKSVVVALTFEVGRSFVRDFSLEIGNTAQAIVVKADAPLVDRVTSSVGHVLTSQPVQEIPLNGRHFSDLALLTPGSVAPSQAGFSSTPIRGIGAIA